ncbi:hypothetical protein SeLEV6574_g03114 [Synchytrium endobioticum]|uniref:Uncharacterized protein n=1 Tax=Synchytrium endobioticum TaxID=286115 RepID=A0A507D5E7_9FUNG|nr:hypothetical protein SeLEV6574_g03114 [Synchytrium endobioticum]
MELSEGFVELATAYRIRDLFTEYEQRTTDRDFKTALSKLEEAIELEARDPASNTTTTSQIIANTLHSQQDTSNPTIQGSKRL